MNRRVPNGTHGGVRGRKSPLETFSYSIAKSESQSGTAILCAFFKKLYNDEVFG